MGVWFVKRCYGVMALFLLVADRGLSPFTFYGDDGRISSHSVGRCSVRDQNPYARGRWAQEGRDPSVRDGILQPGLITIATHLDPADPFRVIRRYDDPLRTAHCLSVAPSGTRP